MPAALKGRRNGAKALCQWPGCEHNAVSEIRTGLLPFKCICKFHRQGFMKRDYPTLAGIEWSERGGHRR